MAKLHYSPEQVRPVGIVYPIGTDWIGRSVDVIDRVKSVLTRSHPDYQVFPEGRITRLRQKHAQALRATLASMTDEALWGPESTHRPWQQGVGMLTVGEGEENRWRRARTYSDGTRIEVWNNMPAAYRRREPRPGAPLVRDARDTGIEIGQAGMRCVVDVAGGFAMYEAREINGQGQGEIIQDRLGSAAVYGLVRDTFAEYLDMDLPK